MFKKIITGVVAVVVVATPLVVAYELGKKHSEEQQKKLEPQKVRLSACEAKIE